MPANRNDMNLAEEEIAQRAIILQVLRDDHTETWSRAELESEIYGIEPLAISDALATLEAEGVVNVTGEQVRASRATWHLDTLGMIAI